MKTWCFFYHLNYSLQGDCPKCISPTRRVRLETPEYVVFPSLPSCSEFPWFKDCFYKILYLCLFPNLNTSMWTESKHHLSHIDILNWKQTPSVPHRQKNYWKHEQLTISIDSVLKDYKGGLCGIKYFTLTFTLTSRTLFYINPCPNMYGYLISMFPDALLEN